ncbi:GNAT family N-acetyltransferase [Candidatus Woesearchaeota archaeon]|nr:GNAT family N-acetyltransferase [Candidatus Woesearchaeota archaeon]
MDAQELLKLHFALVSDLEFTEISYKKNHALLFNKNVEDHFSNFALIFSVAKNEVETVIKKVEKYFLSKNRTPAFYFLKNNPLESVLLSKKYKIAFRDAILIHPAKRAPLKTKLRIVEVANKKELNDYLSVSISVFSSGDKDDLYSDLRKSFFEQVKNNWLNSKKKKKLKYFVGYEGNTPVAVGGMTFNKDFAYFFDLAVLKSARNKGYGSDILTHRINTASELGLKFIYLLTEDESKNDVYFQAKGFKKVGSSVCYTKKTK